MPEVDPCPLCGSQEARLLQQIPYEMIWRGLAEMWAPPLTEVVIERHTPSDFADLFMCQTCDLHYFSPTNPGDSDFYRELGHAPEYYRSERWEFAVVAGRLRRDESVLDLGCGRGAFLRHIAERTARSVGVDHNEDAVRELHRYGIEAYAADFDVFADAHESQFDTVCAFHTLEHLPSVNVLLHPAIRCLKPGGRVFLSVPNRERFTRTFKASDCPPHHVSRWAARQFAVLAERFGLELTDVWFERRTAWDAYRVASRLSSAARDRVRRRTGNDVATHQETSDGVVVHLKPRPSKNALVRLTYGETVLGEFRWPRDAASLAATTGTLLGSENR